MKEALAERNARYLAEGRTVSGANNPGDKPGSVAVSLFLDQNDPQLLQSIVDLLIQAGFTVDQQTPTSVLMERGYQS